jgi:hypothetical protein
MIIILKIIRNLFYHGNFIFQLKEFNFIKNVIIKSVFLFFLIIY